MAKSEKPAEEAKEGDAPKPKSKKKLLIFAGVAVLLFGLAGGGGWYYWTKIRTAKPAEKKEDVKAPVVDPVFLVLEPLTVNLQHEEGEQFLQIGITLKIMNQESSEKIRAHMPEVRSRIIFLLSSKHASELLTVEGKKKLAEEIKAETAASLSPHPAAGAASQVAAASAPAAAPAAPAAGTAPAEGDAGAGVMDVLFTAFIIQ